MDKKFAIFDMDGTLVDSMPYWRDLAQELLALHNITQIPAGVFEAIEAMTASQSARYFVEVFQLDCTPQDLEAEMSQIMAGHYCNDIDLKPNAREYIQQLKANGTRLCVASVTNLELVKACLSRLQIIDCFDFIRSCQTLGISKDQPDIYLGCAKTFGCEPPEVAVFEDALFAAQTAKNAGFHVVGVYDDGAKAKWLKLQALAQESMVDFVKQESDL